MSDPLKVLFICHNHPSIYPGGAEQSALELYEEMRDHQGVEPVLLARVGRPFVDKPASHPGTAFAVIDSDVHQLAIHTDDSDFDWLNLTLRHKGALTNDIRDLLLAQRPDVVHVHHVAYLGVDLLRQIRNTLPEVPIVYTLHEFFPICHRGGVMVRTRGDELCTHESPKRCSECFPDLSSGAFFMRKRFIQSQLSLVDLFLAPSRFLLERYVEWGIPAGRIVFSDYGRLPPKAVAPSENRTSRNRLGFFGQLNPWKGITVLLEAMQRLEKSKDSGYENGVRLRIHGSKVEGHFDGFDERFDRLVEAASGNVTLVGPYRRDDVPDLMAAIDWVVVPSIWWENSPLVIQEAFQHGRPVICSGIGAMAEKVTDGVNGLHFRAGDAENLCETISYAVSRPGLWDRLRAGVPAVPTVGDQALWLIDVYRKLTEAKGTA
jgi:glycosyltransferase involved in cell wall biosynthesis